MNLIDTHSHLFSEQFSDDLPQVIERARAAGVSHIFLPNIDVASIEPLLAVSQAYRGFCFPMIGLHPTSVDLSYEKELATMAARLAAPHEFVAIGEIGLDLYWDKTYLREQCKAFVTQLEWALTYQLPVVIHIREAFEELYELLLPYQNSPLKGIFHSFCGTRDEAFRLLEFSQFLLGINGVVTFKNATLPELLPDIPLRRLVLETDSPYLTPVPYRGKRNESAYVKEVLMKIAAIYQEQPADVAQITSENALKMFGIPQ